MFPSLLEGTPLTAFEALAMGKPIVSTDADGLKDILTGNRDALIVPRENPQALADAIVALANDPAQRAALGAEARLTGARYDIRAFVEKMERLYVLLHEAKGRHGRAAVLREDLSFLRRTASASTRPRRPRRRRGRLHASGRAACWRGACRCRRIRASPPVC